MRLHTLGGLDLEGTDFRRPKPLLLLTYLVLEGARERGHLAQLFFGRSERARANLSVALSRLRAVAPELIDADAIGLRTDVESDVGDLLDALDRNEPSRAVELYRGRFLAGVDTSDLGTELEEWVYLQRERLGARVRRALLTLAEQTAASGRFADGAAFAERAYLLSGAPEPDAPDLTRLHTLFAAADHPLAAEIVVEAGAHDLTLDPDRERARRALTTVDAIAIPSNPYRGLAAFREEDAGLFHGRDAASAELAARLQHQPMVAIVGASGSGKSSLVFAGVVPILRGQGWDIATFRPGRQPFIALAAASLALLEPDRGAIDQLRQAKRLGALLRSGELTLGDLLERSRQQRPDRRSLLIVDQFEELHTFGGGTGATGDEERFLETLLAPFAEATPHGRLLLTLRADVLGAALRHRPLVDLLQRNEYLLGPMSRDELRAAIEHPAGVRGVALEAGLTERILQDVRGHDVRLPLLQFALSELWERQRHRTLTHDAYAAMGGVQQALVNHAEAVFQQLDPDEQTTAQHLFLQLVHPGEGQEDSRRVATDRELGDAWPLAVKLASVPSRLIVTGRSESGERTAEIVHETLIRRWDRLRTWLDEHRDFRNWQERLRRETRLWQEIGKPDNALLQGFHLDEAARWLSEHGSELGNDEQDYIELSLAFRARLEAQTRARTAERERLQRLNTRRLRLLLGLATLLLAMAGWQWRSTGLERDRAVRAQAFAEEQQRRIEQQAQTMLVDRLGSDALRALQDPGDRNGHVDRALLLAAQAVRLQESADSIGNLLGILQELGDPPSHHVTMQLRDTDRKMAFGAGGRLLASSDGHTLALWDLERRELLAELPRAAIEIRAIAVAADGALLATGDRMGTIVLWNVATRSRLATLQPQTPSPVETIAFAPDGRTLAAGTFDGTVELWDVDTGSPTGEPLSGHGSAVTRVAFAPRGHLLASASRDRSIVLWDTRTATAVGRLTGHESWVTGLAFAADGGRLASGSLDGTVRLWDVAAQRALGPPRRSPEGMTGSRAMLDVALSPDGRTLAAADYGGSIALWSVTDRSLAPIPHELPNPQRATEILFDAGGDRLLSAHDDGTVRLWLLEEPKLTAGLAAPSDREVLRLAFTPGGEALVSSDSAGRVEFWDLERRVAVGEPLRHLAPVWGLDISPDGSLIATGSNDLTVRLWNAETHQQLGEPLRGHTSGITSVAFSPDGELLVSADLDGAVHFWDVASRTALADSRLGHDGTVWSLGFHPDGHLLASGGSDGLIRLWDVARRAPLGETLRGHGDDVFAVTFSPDGRLLAGGSGDRTVTLWDVAEREQLTGSPIRHGAAVRRVIFSPDGAMLASVTTEPSSIHLWNVATRTLLGRPLQGSDLFPIRDIDFGGGNLLAVGSGTLSGSNTLLLPRGSIVLWTIDPDSLLAAACSLAKRNLTRAEWQQYLRDRSYEKTCPDHPAGR